MRQLRPLPIRSAHRDDICNTFDRYIDRLFQLAFVLGGDVGRAEEIYMAALDDCLSEKKTSDNVDPRRRARKAIVEAAVRMIGQPHSVPDSARSKALRSDGVGLAILSLGNFDRFVFAMTSLEGIPDDECAEVLLGSRSGFAQARVRAVQVIAIAAGVPERQASFEHCRSDQNGTVPGEIDRL